MGWFDDLLTDTARQAAPGISQAITDDQKKKRDLEAMRQTIPILVEQQKALLPGEMEKARAGEGARSENALRLMMIGKDMDRQRALEVEQEKAKRKGVPTPEQTARTTLSDYITNPGTVRNTNYSAGDEALSGIIPPGTQTSPAAPSAQAPLDPRKVAALGIQGNVSLPEPLMRVLFGGPTKEPPTHIIPPQPGQPPYSWGGPGQVAQPIPGVPSRPETVEKPNPLEKMGPQNLAVAQEWMSPGGRLAGKLPSQFTSADWASINSEADARALKLQEGRGEGFLASRITRLYDASTGRVKQMDGLTAKKLQEAEPDKYYDTSDPMFRASAGELSQVQAQRGKIMAFMYAADRNLKLAEAISDAVQRSDIPALNKYVLQAGESLKGATGPVALNIGMQVAAAEMSKVTASPTGAGVVAREDREKWERLIRGAQTPEQVRVAVRTMHEDMASRKYGYDRSIWEIHQRLGMTSPEPKEPAIRNPVTTTPGAPGNLSELRKKYGY